MGCNGHDCTDMSQTSNFCQTFVREVCLQCSKLARAFKIQSQHCPHTHTCGLIETHKPLHPYPCRAARRWIRCVLAVLALLAVLRFRRLFFACSALLRFACCALLAVLCLLCLFALPCLLCSLAMLARLPVQACSLA